MTVRLAREEDFVDLMYLGKKLAKKAGGYAEWDAGRIEQILRLSLENESVRCFVLTNKDEEIVGGLLAAITELPTANVKVAAEIGFFADTDGFARWDKLIKAFDEWAAYMGVTKSFMSVTHGSLPSPGYLFEKLGYEKAETIYYKRH